MQPLKLQSTLILDHLHHFNPARADRGQKQNTKRNSIVVKSFEFEFEFLTYSKCTFDFIIAIILNAMQQAYWTELLTWILNTCPVCNRY